MINAIAFESVERNGRYVSDGPDVATADINGETDQLEDALLIIRKDFQPPDLKDIDDFYEFFSTLTIVDYEAFKKHSTPVRVTITKEQLKTIRQRNEW